MKTFVFTYDRFDTISTSQWLGKHPHTVLCHTVEQRKQFVEAGRVGGKLVATGRPKGLSNNRNYALDQLKAGEWALFLVDDLNYIVRYENYFTYKGDKLNVHGTNLNIARKLFKHPCTASEFFKICEETIVEAERRNVHLVGFSLTDAPLFRRNKWSHRGLADGRCWLVKKSSLRFDENVQLIDDVCFTALNIKHFGSVLINNWVLPSCKRYTKGSFGSIEQRMPQRLKECRYLVEHYPDQVRYADKVGWPDGSHVALK